MTNETSPADFRPFLEDLLRLGLQGSEGYTNRAVDQIQLEYITNPYGRQPPHLIVFPDGRIEQMTSFQIPIPGYATNVLAVEVMGVMGQQPTPTQLETIARLGSEVQQIMPGRLGFTGNPEMVAAATGSAAPPLRSEVSDTPPAPFFFSQNPMAVAPVPRSSVSIPVTPVSPVSVQSLFDVLGTPVDRRSPLPPGSIFNNSFAPGRGAAPVEIRIPFKAPNARDVVRLVMVPSHDPHKPEPEDEASYTLDALRKADQRLGMSDFRGHYLISKEGELISGRSLELNGNCWPGKNDGAIQVVLAGNGKSPTEAQRRTIYEFGVAMRRHYEKPLQAAVRDIVFGEGLLGVDPNGRMQEQMANAALVTADVGARGKVARAV